MNIKYFSLCIYDMSTMPHINYVLLWQITELSFMWLQCLACYYFVFHLGVGL